ncbi:hypothetical protein CLAFUW4_05424 [Fulvia fulva]|nr:uncharacterized protein CLAFUR5_20200 [Fulvia fulva]KAK4624390.1 hypothetical protein CLAFUR4_05418 [Fulvia fulva]KAK4625256.1 hypothetical protein CLAFUR0_05426 [Fulvia fulva]WMI38892.1 hypothetical protein CLAFUR5_20200 [Fulvia fulva]WPV14595.1 hypothetical protein CLAFUW4_05424 [Fulvia fulva]WPV29553.1 hypothetical protein CLAFUW7_05422 [Fulvia fulva]
MVLLVASQRSNASTRSSKAQSNTCSCWSDLGAVIGDVQNQTRTLPLGAM